MRADLRTIVLIALSGLLAAGCAGRAPLVTTQHVSVVQGELPPPEIVDIAGDARPYRIGPFDKLRVDVFGARELSAEEVQADASGKISLPLIGVVDAGGKTPGELARLIETALAGRYVRNPQVSVNLRQTVSQVMTVDGEVREPGLYPVIGRMTLMRAIATAKGTSEFAKLDDVVVFRTVNGQRLAALYNLGAIRRGAYADPEIYANDIITVGDSPGRRIFRDVLAAAPLLSAPLIAVLQ